MREITKIVRNTMMALMFGYLTAIIVVNVIPTIYKFLVIACIFYTAFLMTSMIGQIAAWLHEDAIETPVLSMWMTRKIVEHPDIKSLDDAEFYKFIRKTVNDCQYVYSTRIK